MAGCRQTHEVFNQSPPLGDMDPLYSGVWPLNEAVDAFGVAEVEGRWKDFGTALGPSRNGRTRAGAHANEYPPRLQHASTGRGFARTWSNFIPPITASWTESIEAGLHVLDLDGRRELAPWPRPRWCAARQFYMARAESRHGHLCPITMTRAAVGALAAGARAARAVWCRRSPRTTMTPRFAAVADKAWHDDRHGHDREAGRHRRARQHHARESATATPTVDRAQMVHVRADVRRLSGPGAGAKDGLTCFLLPRFRAGRQARTRLQIAAPEGQARQSLQCVVRGRVRRRR